MAHSKIMILAVLSILVLGLSACDGGNTSSSKVFSGGTNGLLLSLEEEAPPDLVYDNEQSPFGIMVRAKNDGEFDTRFVKFTVSGINDRDFVNLERETEYEETIIGRTLLEDQVIDGEEAYIPLGEGNIVYQRPLAGGGELDFAVIVDACYPYATIATSKVCLQDNYLDGNNDVCDPRSSNEISVSGAPVQITSFEQQAVATDKLRLQYTFSLKNNVEIWAPLGSGGRSLVVGYTQDCRPETRTERVNQENWIYVELDTNFDDSELTCVNLVETKPGFEGTHVKWSPQAYVGGGITGRSINLASIEPQVSGYLRLGSDGMVRLTCTMTVPPNIGDSFGTVDVLSTYYVKDRVTRSLTVTHSNT